MGISFFKNLLELRGFNEIGHKKCSGSTWPVVSLNKYYLLLLPAWNGALPTKLPCSPLRLETSIRKGTDTSMHTHMHMYMCIHRQVRAHTHAQAISQDPALSLLRKPLWWSSASPHTTPPTPDSPGLFSMGLFTFSYLPYC